MKKELEQLAPKSKFIKQSLQSVETKGYKFVLYDGTDSGMNPVIKKYLKDPSIMALTDPSAKLIYISLEKHNTLAPEANKSPKALLYSSLAAELLHVQSDFKYSPLNGIAAFMDIRSALNNRLRDLSR